MDLMIVLIFILIVVFILIVRKKNKGDDKKHHSVKMNDGRTVQSLQEAIKGKVRKSRPLTMNEQPMFNRLRKTLEPEYVVLAQVSFNALVWARSQAVRNRFNRKMADFVVCDQGFNVIAVVELDDSSHKGNEDKDAERDLLLNEAGITVFRYPFTPDASKILQDIKSVQL